MELMWRKVVREETKTEEGAMLAVMLEAIRSGVQSGCKLGGEWLSPGEGNLHIMHVQRPTQRTVSQSPECSEPRFVVGSRELRILSKHVIKESI